MAAAADASRGKYLASAVCLCVFCHSEVDYSAEGFPPKEGKAGAGRSPFNAQLPWLTCPNLTPDKETGIGMVSDHQLEMAIRRGVSHTGRTLDPMMPYAEYRGMSDEDVASIILFLKTIPPVRNNLPPTQIPDSIKSTLAPQPPAGNVTAPSRAEGALYGAYLARLAVCADCHTPRDTQGKPIPGMQYAGGMPFKGPWGEVSALNLTQDASGAEGLTEKMFISAMRTGHVAGGRRLVAIMPWGYYGHMTDEDLKALFSFLQALKPVSHFVDNVSQPSHCNKCGGFHGLGSRN